MTLLCLMGTSLLAQNDSNRVSVKPYGFIRNYLTFDSRKTYTVVGGEYNMMPYDELWNEDHSEDINDVASLRLQALTSRFGLDITGPRIFGWNSTGKLEGDFGGFGTNNTVLRLRLAYVRLNKGGSELLVGQDWHPLSGNIMPEVLGMAAGAPFRPHSRTPQIRGVRYFGYFGYTAALLWQLQYMNNGPVSASNSASTASVAFAHNAILPESFLGINFKSGAWYLQLGADAQLLRPYPCACGWRHQEGRRNSVFHNSYIICSVCRWRVECETSYPVGSEYQPPQPDCRICRYRNKR